MSGVSASGSGGVQQQTHDVLSDALQSQSEVIAGKSEQGSLRHLEDLLKDSSDLFSGFQLIPPCSECPFTFRIPTVEQVKGENRFTPSHRSYMIHWTSSLPQYTHGTSEAHVCTRRYKDFLWIRSQLLEQFPGVIVPPIPPKSLSSAVAKFSALSDEEVALYRQRALLKFLYRVASIPQLAESPLFQRFLEYDAEEMKNERTGKVVVQDGPVQPGIKRSLGRRFREFTFSLGGSASRSLKAGSEGPDWLASITEYTDSIKNCMESLKEKVTSLSKRRRDLSKEVEKLGEAMAELSTVESEYNESKLAKALQQISEQFPALASSLERQAEQEMLEIVETIDFYERSLVAVEEQTTSIQNLRVTHHLLRADMNSTTIRVEEAQAAGKNTSKLAEDLSNLTEREETAHDLLMQLEAVFKNDLERFQAVKQSDFRCLMASFVRVQLELSQSFKVFWEQMVPCIDTLRSCGGVSE